MNNLTDITQCISKNMHIDCDQATSIIQNTNLSDMQKSILQLAIDWYAFFKDINRTPTFGWSETILQIVENIDLDYGLNLLKLDEIIESDIRLLTQVEFVKTNVASLLDDTSMLYNLSNLKTNCTMLKNTLEKWKQTEFCPTLEYACSNGLFDGDQAKQTADIDTDILLNVEAVANRHKLSVYRAGNEKVFLNDLYLISEKIFFVSDVEYFLSHVQNQASFVEAQKNNKVFVSLFCKIDVFALEESKFFILFQKGKSVWISKCKYHRFDQHKISKMLIDSEIDSYLGRDEEHSMLPYSSLPSISKDVSKDAIVDTRFSQIYGFKLACLNDIADKNLMLSSDYYEWKKREKQEEKYKLLLSEIEKELANYVSDIVDCNNLSFQFCSFTGGGLYSVKISASGKLLGVYDFTNNQLQFFNAGIFIEKPFKDLAFDQKLNLVFLINRLKNKLAAVNLKLPTIKTANEQLMVLAQNNYTFDLFSNSLFFSLSEQEKAMFKKTVSLINKLEQGTKDIVLTKSIDSIKQLYQYESDELVQSTIVSDYEQIMVNNIIRDLNSRLNRFQHQINDAFKWVHDKLTENNDAILQKLFSYSEVSYLDLDGNSMPVVLKVDKVSKKSAFEGIPYTTTAMIPDDLQAHPVQSRSFHFQDNVILSCYVDNMESFHLSVKDAIKAKCSTNPNRLAKNHVRVRLYDHTVIMWLLGLDSVEQLPKVLQVMYYDYEYFNTLGLANIFNNWCHPRKRNVRFHVVRNGRNLNRGLCEVHFNMSTPVYKNFKASQPVNNVKRIDNFLL